MTTAPPPLTLQLDLATVQALVRGAFPGNDGEWLLVEGLEPGYARIRLPMRSWMQRPGGLISGPTQMTAADTAMYVVTLAHIGAQLMAVTADMNLRFLNKAPMGDVLADARILKLGRRTVVLESRVWSSATPEAIAMHGTGSYALPAPHR